MSKKDIDHEIPLNIVIGDETIDAGENDGDYTTSNKSGNKRRSRTKSPSSRKRSKSTDKSERKRRSGYDFWLCRYRLLLNTLKIHIK